MRVLIGGFFDLIHSGHILAFNVAQAYGDLIVNVSPDIRAREKKGDGRPILSAAERKFIVGSIKGVTEVYSVEAKEEMSVTQYTKKMLDEIKPDIFIYAIESSSVENYCKKHGIKFVYLPEIPGIDGLHSTDIIERAKCIN